MSQINRNVLLVSGKSSTGKSASLRNLANPEGVMYLNCEAGKELPFPNKFQKFNVIDPDQIYQAVEKADSISVHTIVIDTLTFLMDMYETQRVYTATDSRAAWAGYAQFFKILMQKYVASSDKNIVFLAHTADIYNEKELVVENMVKVKGSLMNQGIEAFFTQVVSSKKVSLKLLEGFSNPLLNITEEEELLGYKYVFQTKLTKETVNERIRAPLGMWSRDYTYIDNDLQAVIDHTHQYYSP